MVDIEMLRIEKLIEEREAYEKAFFSMEPIVNDENLELINDFEFTYEVIFEEFEFDEDLHEPAEDYFEKLREEKLIKERIIYEIDYFKDLDYNIIEIDLDKLTEPYEEPDYDLGADFEMYFDDFFDSLPIEEPTFTKLDYCWCDEDYLPHDYYDNQECYDYPEGPKENLCGIIHY